MIRLCTLICIACLVATTALGQSLSYQADRSSLVVVGEARHLGSMDRIEVYQLQVERTLRGHSEEPIYLALPRHVSVHAAVLEGERALYHLVSARGTSLYDEARARFGDLYLPRSGENGTVGLEEEDGDAILAVATRLAELSAIQTELPADAAAGLESLLLEHLDSPHRRVVASLARDLAGSKLGVARLDAADCSRILDRALTSRGDVAVELLHLAVAADAPGALQAALDRAAHESDLVLPIAGIVQYLAADPLQRVLDTIDEMEDLEQVSRLARLATIVGGAKGAEMIADRALDTHGARAQALLQALAQGGPNARDALAHLAEVHPEIRVRHVAKKTLSGRR